MQGRHFLNLQLWLLKSFWSSLYFDSSGDSFLSWVILSTVHFLFSVFSSFIDLYCGLHVILLNYFFRINSQDWDTWANGSEFCFAFVFYCHLIFQKRLSTSSAVCHVHCNLTSICVIIVKRYVTNCCEMMYWASFDFCFWDYSQDNLSHFFVAHYLKITYLMLLLFELRVP